MSIYLSPSALPVLYDVLIVGAGPAGLGCAAALAECGVEKMVVVDHRGVGASFDAWPAQMRMISPSFHSNAFGQVDLNAITPHTSPADFVYSEHPTGPEYAKYLRAIADHYRLEIKTGVEVKAVEESSEGIVITGSSEEFRARHVIWAAGEFFFPQASIRGSSHCVHNSKVEDWSALPGVEHAIIGGFESGIDAAIHLTRLGRSVHVFSRGEPWHRDSPDPSRTLSPYTVDRLKDALLNAPGSFRFYKNANIVEVASLDDRFVLLDDEDEPFEISTPPILCNGFTGGLGPVARFFENEDGDRVFTEDADESPLLPNLFYSGPMLEHRQSLFCFIYKFRARFGIVAKTIAERLKIDWEEPLHDWKTRGFMTDDLSCCDDCHCAVESAEELAPAEVEDYATATR